MQFYVKIIVIVNNNKFNKKSFLSYLSPLEETKLQESSFQYVNGLVKKKNFQKTFLRTYRLIINSITRSWNIAETKRCEIGLIDISS